MQFKLLIIGTSVLYTNRFKSDKFSEIEKAIEDFVMSQRLITRYYAQGTFFLFFFLFFFFFHIIGISARTNNFRAS